MLGGSSSINAMIYIRGNQRDYDRWAELGNDGWSFKDILPYFKKSEDRERGESNYHGVGGPLNVADLRAPNILSKAFVKASLQAGFVSNEDFNAAEQEGFGFFQVTQKNGKRHSTARAYLKPALKRSNLRVETEARVLQVTFDGKQATGVKYTQNNQVLEVKARKEVILCGGTISSAQLLLVSGIGPADDLKDSGIPVIEDLPGVGQNLQDHLCVTVNYACLQPVSLARAGSLKSLLNFLLFKKGLLTSNVGEAGGFFKSRLDLKIPNLQIIFGPTYYLNHGFNNPQGDGFTIGPVLLQPKSRGYIRLKSPDPLRSPGIFANYCSHEEDMETLVWGVKIARKIAMEKPLTPYRGKEHTPGDEAQSDEEIRAFIRREAQTLYHPVGTCKMGTDAMAVVNSKLEVRGVKGLRVVDASVMPIIVNGNTNAPTIAIAEKASDLI